MEQPTYRHKCGSCVFLGAGRYLGEVHDLYLCNRTLVIVRSDNPEDTFGVLAFGVERREEMQDAFPSVVEAYRLAMERGLI